MAREAAEILEEALALPAEARAALIDSLLDSLDCQVDEDAEERWKSEILERLKQLDERAVRLVSWAEVRKRLVADVQRDG